MAVVWIGGNQEGVRVALMVPERGRVSTGLYMGLLGYKLVFMTHGFDSHFKQFTEEWKSNVK